MDEPKKRRRDEWSVQALETLREMRAAGKSCDAIAMALNISRSAVSGKISRLGLPLAPHVRANFNPESHEEKKKKLLARAVKVLTEEERRAVPLLKLKDFHCRAVIDLEGKRGLATYCGRRKKKGTAWCPEHYAMYVEPERYPLHGQASKRFK
jgi:hypothetical protein